jgi:hypothetical protein
MAAVKVGRFVALPSFGFFSIDSLQSINGMIYPLTTHCSRLIEFRIAISPTSVESPKAFRCSYTETHRSSKAHFRQALLNRFPASSSLPSVPELSTGAKQSILRKMHKCPHEGCLNEYKQKSGLRYHLSHVSIPCCQRQNILTPRFRDTPLMVQHNCRTSHLRWQRGWPSSWTRRDNPRFIPMYLRK